MAKTRDLKRNKKGLLPSMAVGIAAALGLGILLLLFSKQFISIANAENIIEGCHLSVGLASWQLNPKIGVLPLGNIDSPFQLNCQTIYNEVTKSSINRADDKVTLSSGTARKKEQLKESVMKNMRDCWYMFGEGKWKVQQAVDASGTACVVCSEIIIDDAFIKANPTITSLDDMYGYATKTMVPPKNEKSYMDYFMENAVSKPTLPGGVTGDIPLDKNHKQYSIVFAITAEAERKGGWFGLGGSVIPADSGITDCYIAGKDGKTEHATKGDAKDIGCDDNGNTNGLIFGKVIDGGTDVDLLNWKNFVPGMGFGTGGPLGSAVTLRTYPATVRLVPTASLTANCARLY